MIKYSDYFQRGSKIISQNSDLLNTSEYYLVQELQRVLYFSVWAKGYFIIRLLKWIWDSLFNRTQINLLRMRFKKYPFPVRDYLVSLHPVVCKRHNLCAELDKKSTISDEEKLDFIAHLVYTTHLTNYYQRYSDSHKLTAALIMKLGVENFCNCDEILQNG